ncbi:MAG: DUF3126 family protein [Hyphomonadaceae bacterium]
MQPDVVKKLETYLRRTLNPGLTLAVRPRVTDSVEVMLGGEHVGLVYLIEDEGETSYQLEVTILEEDLYDVSEGDDLG